MAISTDDGIVKFGTQDKVSIASTAAVADNAFSVAGDVSAWTNDDDAPEAAAVLEANFSTAPTARTVINLYARLMDIQGTNDALVPTSDVQHTFLGAFPLKAVTTLQYVAIDVALPLTKSSQIIEFYLENKSGQSLPSGWDLWVTPRTVGPKA